MSGLETIGILALGYLVVRLGLFLYRLLSPMRIDVKTFGQWAVVTGSTDGIGKAYALELGKRGQTESMKRRYNDDCWIGLNVVLISRTKEKLDGVAQEIQEKYANVQVRIIPFDFSSEIIHCTTWLVYRFIIRRDFELLDHSWWSSWFEYRSAGEQCGHVLWISRVFRSSERQRDIHHADDSMQRRFRC